MSLINNPLAELLHPVSRLETAVADLSGDIAAVRALPQIEAELRETQGTTLLMLDEVRRIREDVGRLTAALEEILERSQGPSP